MSLPCKCNAKCQNASCNVYATIHSIIPTPPFQQLLQQLLNSFKQQSSAPVA